MTHEVLRLMWRATWAILPDALRATIAAAQAGPGGSPPALADATVARTDATLVAIVPVQGMVSYRAGLFSDFFGGAVVERIAAQLQAAIAEPQVRSVVLRIDSPGGMVAGVPELAALIREARAVKPILAIADTVAASAAYWIGAQASEFWATPSADVGSIGVYAIHEDYSKLLEQVGITVTLVSAGERKVDGNPYQPLSDEARADMQGRVDEVYGQFLADVAKGRGVPVATVRESYGQGRVLGATEAKAAGLVDRIGTFGQALARATKLRTPMQAAADELEIRARRHDLWR